jgi:hypothetical protein
VQKSIEHCGREGLVVGEGASPLREGQVAREHHAPALVALGDDIEEQVGLFPAEGQVADLVDDQQLGPDDGAVEVFLQPPLALGRGELQHQIGSGQEANLVASSERPMAQCQGDVGLAHAARAEQYHVGSENGENWMPNSQLMPQGKGAARGAASDARLPRNHTRRTFARVLPIAFGNPYDQNAHSFASTRGAVAG